jgi:alanine dehydrogenase
MSKPVTIGFPRMHLEPGERRDFLPELMSHLVKDDAQVYLEHGYGSGMGLQEKDYLQIAPGVQFVSNEEAYAQDVVVVLRYPGDEKLRSIRPGACLMTMVHYPTRPYRVEYLRSLGIEAISLDSLKDDVGKRLVENLRAVGWNGVDIGFQVLRSIYPPPGIEDPNRLPVKVTVMGVGAVGMFAIQAAIRYGNQDYWRKMALSGVTGVQVTAVDYDLTNHPNIMHQIVKYTDILVDATQRVDTSQPIIPNEWIGSMRAHAILVDLSVDPYDVHADPPSVKGIEGIPQGNLDQYIFTPDDPIYETLPPGVRTENRRHAVSCYSWPGIYPDDCMQVYGNQLRPILQTIVNRKGVPNLQSQVTYFERAIHRARLSYWNPDLH